ncbi:Competence protein CoiA-like family, contains a predicted nuclease domain [Gracilibacillus orientalis]|uniref:Competence protein CoiA-like family, contains a predicted nuclease domain n=1 Tax=Gracilibacillus orientalis TaxID=334253 RepID=A0A1I4H2V9_9BACI|nr:competence protein CoiA family protein [Gracilibacillus orientalis]SFL36652.1 Competence protein CoiA-like family, contains a predicted nuclease domain [Gracilibacillus orientalis]
MLQAVNQVGELVPIWKMNRDEIKQKRKERFFCPDCSEPLMIKAGMKNTPHFAHHSKSNCTLSGEGSYHENGKKDIYLWLHEQGYQVALEHYFPDIRQRADVYLELKKKRIAIEYQCAAISIQEICQRTAGYRSIGVIPIWILGANKLQRRGTHSLNIPSNDHAFLHQFHPSLPTSIFYYCSNTKRLIIYQDLIFLSKTKVFGALHISPLTSLVWSDLFRPRYCNKKLFNKYWNKQKEKWRNRPVPYYQREETKWRQWLYLHQLNILSLPSFIYLPITTQYLMKSPPWIWQSRLYVDLILIKEFFTISQAMHLLRDHYHPADNFSLIQTTNHPVSEYLQLLVRIGILKGVSEANYQVNRTTV